MRFNRTYHELWFTSLSKCFLSWFHFKILLQVCITLYTTFHNNETFHVIRNTIMISMNYYLYCQFSYFFSRCFFLIPRVCFTPILVEQLFITWTICVLKNLKRIAVMVSWRSFKGTTIASEGAHFQFENRYFHQSSVTPRDTFFLSRK